ncbi:PHP domain-containing protein [bacterium]|nr:PHP domain-containing protein [bacterium]
MNKIHPLGSLEDVFFKKFISLNITNEQNHKKISFKIKGFKDPGKSFVILKDLQQELHHFYDVDFATSSKDLDSIKAIILQLIPSVKQEDFDLQLNKKTYELLCHDDNTLNALKNEEVQTVFNILGINHDKLLQLMQVEESHQNNDSSPQNNNVAATCDSTLDNQVANSQTVVAKEDATSSLSKEETSSTKQPAPQTNPEVDPKQALIEKYQTLNAIHSTAIPTSLQEATTNAQLVNKQILVQGEIFKIEKMVHDRKNTDGHGALKTTVYNIYITDHNHAMCLNALISDNSLAIKSNLCEAYLDSLQEGSCIKALVKVIVDKYEHDDQVGKIEKIITIQTPVSYQLGDASDRVELDFHTNMSAFDGLHNPNDVIKYAKEMKIKALSINDFNSTQSFPNLYRLAKDQNVNLIYGAEFDLLNNNLDAVYHPQDFVISNKNRLVFFDLETTGLAPNYNEIIEFGAYITDLTHTYVDKYQSFVRPEGQIDEKITKLTRITSDLLAKGKPIKEFLEELHKVIKDTDILVAHNGINFDIKFLNSWCRKLGIKEFNNPLIDTLILARAFITDIGGYSLGKLSHYFKLEYDEEAVAHRADADAEYLNNVF